MVLQVFVSSIDSGCCNDRAKIVKCVVAASHRATILRSRNLDNIQGGSGASQRREEGQEETATDKCSKVGCSRCDNSADHHTHTTYPDQPSAAYQVGGPDEESTTHLANVEYGEDEAGAGAACSREAVVGGIVLKCID